MSAEVAELLRRLLVERDHPASLDEWRRRDRSD